MKFLAALNLSGPSILKRYLSYLFSVAIFSFAFYFQYSVAFLGLDLHHDLLMFDAARNFYSGQIPYKDFFYQYNLGTLFLHNAALSLLGLKIVSLKKITILFYALIALLIYLSCAIEGYKRSGLLLSILWSLLSPFYMQAMNGYHPWSTVYMMAACMTGLYCLQLANRKNPLVFSFIAGCCFSLSFWFKQVAAYQIIAASVWLVFSIWLSRADKIVQCKYIKIFSGFATGGILTAIPFFGYLYMESVILNWWMDAFVFNKYFSTDSQNASSIGTWLKILFPISRDMGYQSFLWAISPLVLCIVAFQFYFYRRTSFGLSKSEKEILALYILAGFAGWFQFFPLPHQFHTQLFMAPNFIVVGLLLGGQLATWEDLKKNILYYLPIYIFIIFAVYESIRHIDSWYKKRSFFNKHAIQMNLNSTFDGLKIDVMAAERLTQFYRKLVELNDSNKSGEFIPFSVDPIRGLLPGKFDQLSKYKMGVNWTWPNELVEPGFTKKIHDEMQLRSQPIYADSLIYISGYMPVSLLPMSAPISSVHTIYKPMEQKSELLLRDKKSNEILFITDKNLDIKSRNIIFDRDLNKKELLLIPFDGLTESELKSIKNIHVSLIDSKDFPRRLSALQMSYLNKAEKNYSLNLSELFKMDSQGNGVLRSNISKEDEKNLALFMLSTGKLFLGQNHPYHTSTLGYKGIDRPYLVGLSDRSSNIHMLWHDSKSITRNPNQISYQPTEIYLLTKPLVNSSGSKFIIIQIELEYDQMRNYFYSFINE